MAALLTTPYQITVLFVKRYAHLVHRLSVLDECCQRVEFHTAHNLLSRGRVLFDANHLSVGISPVLALHIGGRGLHLLTDLQFAQIVVGHIAEHLAACHLLRLR